MYVERKGLWRNDERDEYHLNILILTNAYPRDARRY